MAYEKILASGFGLSVATVSSGTYTTVSGINNLMFNVDTAEVDGNTFDNDGWGSRSAGLKVAGITAEGFRLADATLGTRDAGQKLVEKAQVSGTLRYWRLFWKTDVTQYIQVAGYASGGSFGGGINENSSWSVEVFIDGAPTFVGAMFNPDA